MSKLVIGNNDEHIISIWLKMDGETIKVLSKKNGIILTEARFTPTGMLILPGNGHFKIER